MNPRPTRHPDGVPTRTRRAAGLLVATLLALTTAAVLGSTSPAAAVPGVGP